VVGETVHIEGVTGFPDGDYLITSIDTAQANNWIVVYTTETVTVPTTVHQGTVTGSVFKYVGCTSVTKGANATRFFDIANDNNRYEPSCVNILELNNIINYPVKNKFTSNIQWTNVNQADNFTGETSIDKYDNDEITGLSSDDDGLLIFKDRNVYKLFTTTAEQYWEVRRILSDIGCSDRLSIAKTPIGHYIFRSNDRLYLWRGMGTIPVLISDKIFPSTVKNITRSRSFYDRVRNWIWFIYDSDDGEGNAFVFDFNFVDDNGVPSVYHFKKDDLNDLKLTDGVVIKSDTLVMGSRLYDSNVLNHLVSYKDTFNYDNMDSENQSYISAELITKVFDYNNATLKKIIMKIGNDSGNYNVIGKVIYDGSIDTFVDEFFGTKYWRVNKNVNYKFKEMALWILLSPNSEMGVCEGTFIKEIAFDYLPEHLKRGAY
jgi:hypothetical protein